MTGIDTRIVRGGGEKKNKKEQELRKKRWRVRSQRRLFYIEMTKQRGGREGGREVSRFNSGKAARRGA